MGLALGLSLGLATTGPGIEPASGTGRVSAAPPARAPGDGGAGSDPAAADAGAESAVPSPGANPTTAEPGGAGPAGAVPAGAGPAGAVPIDAAPAGAAPAGPSTITGDAAAAAVTGTAEAPPDLLTPGTVSFLVLAIVATWLIVRRRWWRLDGSPGPARIFAPRTALLFAAGMLLGSLALGTLVHALLVASPIGAPDLSTLGGQLVLGLPVYGVQALIIAAWWSTGRAAPGRAPGSPAGSPPGASDPATATAATAGRATTIGLLGLLVTWPLVVAVTTLVALLTIAAGGPAPEAIAHDTLARIAADPWHPAALGTILLVTLVVPWIEEVVYRGMLQRGLIGAGLGRWAAILLVAGVFAVRHLGIAAPHAVVGLFVLSIGFSVVTERTGRLTAAVVMHAAFNLGNVAFAVAS